MKKNSFIRKGKKSRSELFLPSLRYVVVDDWVDKLGNDAFLAWLKFHSWVDRRDEEREHDRIPYTLESTWKKLGMGRKKFYEKILKPLWEHWLIDLVEYDDSNRKSQKPKNIVVYESPMNKHETEIQPLKKLRDWDKDYESPSKIFGRRGGQIRKKAKEQEQGDPLHLERVEKYPLHLERVEKYPLHLERVTRSIWNGNNVSNNLLTNTNNNNSNTDKNQTKDNNSKQDNDVVVVVNEIKNKIEKAFGRNISKTSAKTINKLLIENGKDIDDVISQTIAYFNSKGEQPQNLVGSLRYGIESGWDVPEQEDQSEKEEQKKYYDDIRRASLIAAGLDPSIIGGEAK